jgi:hypothetical protein
MRRAQRGRHHGDGFRLRLQTKANAFARIPRRHIEFGDRDSKDGLSDLSQGAFQALRGFLQLALESINLLGYILEFFFCQ